MTIDPTPVETRKPQVEMTFPMWRWACRYRAQRLSWPAVQAALRVHYPDVPSVDTLRRWASQHGAPPVTGHGAGLTHPNPAYHPRNLRNVA